AAGGLAGAAAGGATAVSCAAAAVGTVAVGGAAAATALRFAAGAGRGRPAALNARAQPANAFRWAASVEADRVAPPSTLRRSPIHRSRSARYALRTRGPSRGQRRAATASSATTRRSTSATVIMPDLHGARNAPGRGPRAP